MRAIEENMDVGDAQRNLEKIVQRVAENNDKVVLEVEGQARAVVVPIEIYEQWKRSRDDFFETMRLAAERSNLSPEEAHELATEAVAWARSHKE
ncbi:MAG TPA: type II toxin-antitoxin system Phd/YefM family antitoxin [Chloroflexia bacterium]